MEEVTFASTISRWSSGRLVMTTLRGCRTAKVRGEVRCRCDLTWKSRMCSGSSPPVLVIPISRQKLLIPYGVGVQDFHAAATGRAHQSMECNTGWRSTAQPYRHRRRGNTGTAQHSTAGIAQQAQHSTAQHSTAQHSTAQHSTARHGAAHRNPTRGSTAQHSVAGTAKQAQHSTAQHSMARHGAAHRNPARGSTAQHSRHSVAGTAQHNRPPAWAPPTGKCTSRMHTTLVTPRLRRPARVRRRGSSQPPTKPWVTSLFSLRLDSTL